jgi:hypothetical protein
MAVYNVDGSRKTNVCADQYTDVRCSLCSHGNFKLIDKCQTCGSTALDIISLILILSVALTLFTIIAIAVVGLSPTSLSSFVGNVIILQQFIALAQEALQKLPGDQSSFTLFVSALSGINFDVQLIKPGCIVGRMSFLTLFWSTIGVMSCASLLFTLAAYIRARLLLRKHLQQDQNLNANSDTHLADTNNANNIHIDDKENISTFTGITSAATTEHQDQEPSVAPVTSSSSDKDKELNSKVKVSSAYNLKSEFVNRYYSSQHILGCLIYLRLTTYILQALHCIDSTDIDGNVVSILKADMVGIEIEI